MCIVIATGHPQKTYLDPEEGFGSNEKCIKKVKFINCKGQAQT